MNIIRLLQTLDKDGNPDNGLEITDEAKTNALPVDFSSDVSTFESLPEIINLISNGGQDVATIALISTADAVNHFISSLFNDNDMLGFWKDLQDPDPDYQSFNSNGTFDVPCNGSFISGDYSISSNGEVSVTFVESGISDFNATGQMSADRKTISFDSGFSWTKVVVPLSPNNCDGKAVAVGEYTNTDLIGYWKNIQDSDPDYQSFKSNGTFDVPCNGSFISGDYSISSNGEVSVTFVESGISDFNATGQMSADRKTISFESGFTWTKVTVPLSPNNCSNLGIERVRNVYSNSDVAAFWKNLQDPDPDYQNFNSNGTFDVPCNGNLISGNYSISSSGGVTVVFNETGEPQFTANGQIDNDGNTILYDSGLNEFTWTKSASAPNSCN